ncbi:hypothetical protein GCM10010195_07610 [Kitasatospora griseola]|nr:hypothetical protein GCM10010195_07610 [Kitasatospora griseola]
MWKPCSTRTTRTPNGAASTRSAWCRAADAARLALYQPSSGRTARAEAEEIVTIRPPPARRMPGSTRRAIRAWANTLASISRRACSSPVSPTARAAATATWFTTAQGSPPVHRRTSPSSSSHAPGSVTSSSTARSRTPPSRARARSRSAPAPVRLVATTSNPAPASRRAASSPIP